MGLTTDLAHLCEALDEHGIDFIYHPEQTVPLLLNALAGLLEVTPPATPLGRVLESVLSALPPSALAGAELRRLAATAGRNQDPCLLIPSHEIAFALRTMASCLEGSPARSAPPPEIAPELRLERLASRFLSPQRRELVLYLLEQESCTADEHDVIVHLWPDEQRRKTPSRAARNRLHKLEHDTNEALLVLETSTWKIKRPVEQVLQMVMLG
jgi:hypothetical protein